MDPDLLQDLSGEMSSGTQLLSDLQQETPSDPLTVNSNQTGVVITKIERMFETITDSMLNEKEISIELKSRPKTRNKVGGGRLGSTEEKRKYYSREITFPSKSPQEAWKFTALLRILELSHEALVTGIVTTKRDIYYRDPKLFMKQTVVDRYVDDLAYTFGVQRDALNVVAAAKGLVSGSFKAKRVDGSVIDYSIEPEGILVPDQRDISDVELLDVKWILVIEKEATFSTLSKNHYWRDSISGKGILFTAKGYPDILSRQFLHFLSITHPNVPIFALMDYDPDGIGIMSTYKHSSINLAHESNIAVPSIRWLGVRSADFLGEVRDNQGLLTLSARDRRVASKMLEREDLDEEGSESEWRREVQVMLILNVKAEIQILGSGNSLGEWLDAKLKPEMNEI